MKLISLGLLVGDSCMCMLLFFETCIIVIVKCNVSLLSGAHVSSFYGHFEVHCNIEWFQACGLSQVQYVCVLQFMSSSILFCSLLSFSSTLQY